MTWTLVDILESYRRRRFCSRYVTVLPKSWWDNMVMSCVVFSHSPSCPFLVFSVKLVGARSLTYLPSRPIPSLPSVGPVLLSQPLLVPCPMNRDGSDLLGSIIGWFMQCPGDPFRTTHFSLINLKQFYMTEVLVCRLTSKQ